MDPSWPFYELVPLIALYPEPDRVPFSSTEDHPEFWNQYVAPVTSPRYWRSIMASPLDIQVFADGVPVQAIIWKEDVVQRSLPDPVIDAEQRAAFDLSSAGTAVDPYQVRCFHDAANRRVRLQLIETTVARCYRMAAQTLVEVMPDGRLAALWMLDSGGRVAADDDRRIWEARERLKKLAMRP